MGCASSSLLNQDDEFSQIGGFTNHIVSLTSTTYGLLTLDPPSPAIIPPMTSTPPRKTLGSLFPSPLSEPRSLKYNIYSPLETINSWDLMSGLDSDHVPSFRFSPSPFIPSKKPRSPVPKKPILDSDENVSPNVGSGNKMDLVEKYEMICPPNGENKVVMYSTTLRGVRKTFEDCNAVRWAIEGHAVLISERDISMDKGFREELRELMKGMENSELVPPRLFVKGRYIGGVEEVMRVVEEGCLGDLLMGLPRAKGGYVCEGCGGVRFLPCFTCNGSCKVVKEDLEVVGGKQGNGTVVLRCSDCNENGLVLCPICT